MDVVAEVRAHGVGVFDEVYPVDRLQRIQANALLRFGGADEDELERRGLRVGNERYMFPMPIEGPVNDPSIYAAPAVLAACEGLLGANFIMTSFTVVVAFPGAKKQNVHRDHSYLFAEDWKLSRALPPYALTVIVPLMDLEQRGGGTRVIDDSHDREPRLLSRLFAKHVLNLPLGSAAVMDYRLVHHGTANAASIPRPVLFIVYARRWFRDTENFERHTPIVMAPDEVARIPDEYRDLLLLATRPHLS